MNLLPDVLILLVIIGCAMIGRHRGFIKTFFGFFGTLISFVATSFLARPIGDFIGRSLISPPLKSYFSETLLGKLKDSADSLFHSGENREALAFLSRFHVDSEQLSAFSEHSGQELINSVTDFVVDPLASSLGYAISYLLLFILILVALRILVRVLDLVAKLPILNFSNRALGLVAGLAMGVVFALFLSNLLVFVLPLLKGSENELLRSIDLDQTVIVRYIANLFMNP